MTVVVLVVLLDELDREVCAMVVMAGGAAATVCDFAFRVELVIYNVKTRVAIMTVMKIPDVANFCTYIITMMNVKIHIILFYLYS